MSSGSSEIIMLKYSYWETKDIPELVSSAAAAFTAPACAGTPPALCQRLSGPTQADMLASIINQSYVGMAASCASAGRLCMLLNPVKSVRRLSALRFRFSWLFCKDEIKEVDSGR